MALNAISFLVLSGYTRGIWKVLSKASYLYNTVMKCYQIIQFLETRIQRLFDGLISIEKRTRRARTAHAQNE